MALTAQQLAAAAGDFAQNVFVLPDATANLSVTDIQNALSGLDTAMHATLNQAAAVAGGASTVVAALLDQVQSAVPAITGQQAALVLIYWAKKAAGL